MISWMQRHNKYLVITIWIATIAFIGAGAVGWGSMHFGQRAGSIAKIGDVTVSKLKYQFTYNNFYSEYAQKLGKDFNQESAKKMGLPKLVFQNLVKQALYLNLANEFGIVVSDEEVAKEIASYPFFKDKYGNFDKKIYEIFLKNRGIKAKEFEAILRDDLKIKKLFSLLNIKALDFEKEAVTTAFKIGDKIAYSLVTKKDVSVAVNEKELKEFWQKHQSNYLEPKKFLLAVHWTKAKDVNVSLSALKKYYEQNSFDFTDENGKSLPFEKVKKRVRNSYILNKIKKIALVERARFKKGKIQADDEKTLFVNDSFFPKKVWQKLQNAKEGEFLRPIAIEDKYVTIHVKKVIKPKPMSFEKAKAQVEKDFISQKSKEMMQKKAKEILKSKQKLAYESNNFITLSKLTQLEGLTNQESILLTKEIFTNRAKEGVFAVGDKVVVYRIKDQKFMQNASSSLIGKEAVTEFKNTLFLQNLTQELSKKYKIESYVKDFQ